MELTNITLEPLKNRRVAILGYGNQGRAQALNLRDSGISVVVGSRLGKSADLAREDGFEVFDLTDAAQKAEVVLLLLPDQIIPRVFDSLDLSAKFVGFSHGYAYQFGGLKKYSYRFFLVGPKGAGAILRENFEKGGGLPGVFAVSSADPETRAVALAYAKAIGVAKTRLIETTFQEETECDLFGEQAVLCGGIFQLLQAAFETLVKNGHTSDMAFFETCFEAKTILDLWIKYGPQEVVNRISPTAFFGGLTRGQRIVTEETKKEMEKIFLEIRTGKFHQEWMEEVQKGMPKLSAERNRLESSALSKAWQENL